MSLCWSGVTQVEEGWSLLLPRRGSASMLLVLAFQFFLFFFFLIAILYLLVQVFLLLKPCYAEYSIPTVTSLFAFLLFFFCMAFSCVLFHT